MIRSKVYGSEVREFESMLSKHFDDSYTIAVSNASVGILGILYSLGVQNSEIITTPFTWAGALTPFKMLNNKVIYGTIEEPTLTLNPDTLESFITPNTKVVFSADFIGYPCRLDEIKKICAKYNILLIHDAASSMGTTYKGKYSGYFADITVYSFGRNKPFTTGEGGVVVTKNEKYYEKLIMNIAHPERQDIEMDFYNPFSLNTSLNPLAVRYGIKTFEEQINNINHNRDKVLQYLGMNNTDKVIHNSLPNFYKPIINLLKPIKSISTSDYRDLPFKPLSNNFGFDINILNSYKILKKLCLIK